MNFRAILMWSFQGLWNFFAKRNLKITWFVVGKDASMPVNQPVLRTISQAGHEIGNHSFLHEPWLHLYTRDQLASAGPLCAGAMQARNWGEYCTRYDTRAESVAQLRPTQNWCCKAR